MQANNVGKAFFWSSDLQKHVQTDSEEKTYICKQCGKAFLVHPIASKSMNEYTLKQNVLHVNNV
jgi:hypothetical protein